MGIAVTDHASTSPALSTVSPLPNLAAAEFSEISATGSNGISGTAWQSYPNLGDNNPHKLTRKSQAPVQRSWSVKTFAGNHERYHSHRRRMPLSEQHWK